MYYTDLDLREQMGFLSRDCEINKFSDITQYITIWFDRMSLENPKTSIKILVPFDCQKFLLKEENYSNFRNISAIYNETYGVNIQGIFEDYGCLNWENIYKEQPIGRVPLRISVDSLREKINLFFEAIDNDDLSIIKELEKNFNAGTRNKLKI